MGKGVGVKSRTLPDIVTRRVVGIRFKPSDSGDWCGMNMPTHEPYNSEGYTCTRPKYHTSPHVAHVSTTEACAIEESYGNA